MLLALQLVREEDKADTISIRLDNQAVVWALTSHRAKPAQSLLDAVHELCDDWKEISSATHTSRSAGFQDTMVQPAKSGQTQK